MVAGLVAAEEGVEDAVALIGGDAVAGVGDLDLDPAVHRLGADRHAAVGRRVVDRVLDQVEEHALELLGVGARGAERRAEPGADRHRARLRGGPHGVDRLLEQQADADLLHRPLELAALQPGELEQVVDQRAERAHVGSHADDVLAPQLAVDHVVVERVGEQPQRGHRRAQVVRDGGEQRPAQALLVVEPRHHGVDVGGQGRDLVVALDAGAHVAPALADGRQRAAHAVEVVERAAADARRRPPGERSPRRRRAARS